MSSPLHGFDAIAAALRSWQTFHMDSRGWSDIAYQEAVDNDGNVYVLRGLGTTSGANGDTATNAAYGALLLILAPGEQPTDAMTAAVRRRVAAHRRRFPRSHRIVGHNDIRPEPTSCPGPIVSKLIDAGVFEPDQEPRR
jgi:N-acetylmuramoyl-L-alanine amidase.